MRIRKRHNSVLYIINIVNPNKEFELQKLALERIDKVEDRIIQTNIMFILGLTFLNAVYGILFKNNFLTLFSKTYNFLSLKFTNSISILANSNNLSIFFTLLVLNAIIYYIWYNKTIRYVHIKEHANKLLRNNILKIEDLLLNREKNLDSQYLENILIVLSFLYTAIMPILILFKYKIIIYIYLPIIILIAYAYHLKLNLSNTENQRKFTKTCLIIYTIVTSILIVVWFYYKPIILFLSRANLSKMVIKKFIETILITSIILEVIIFLCTIIVPLIWNDPTLSNLIPKIIHWLKNFKIIREPKNLFIKFFNWINNYTKQFKNIFTIITHPDIAIASLVVLIIIILTKSHLKNLDTFWKLIFVVLLTIVVIKLSK